VSVKLGVGNPRYPLDNGSVVVAATEVWTFLDQTGGVKKTSMRFGTTRRRSRV